MTKEDFLSKCAMLRILTSMSKLQAIHYYSNKSHNGVKRFVLLLYSEYYYLFEKNNMEKNYFINEFYC